MRVLSRTRAVLLALSLVLPFMLIFGSGIRASAMDDFPIFSGHYSASANYPGPPTYVRGEPIVFPFAEGKRALVLDFYTGASDMDYIAGTLVDLENKQVIKEIPFPSDIAMEFEFAFQKKSPVIATADTELAISLVKSDGTTENPISEGYPILGELTHQTLSCSNQLTFISLVDNKSLSYINLKDGKATAVDVLKDERFPSRPFSVDISDYSWMRSTNMCDYWNVSLKDQTDTYVSGALGSDGTYAVHFRNLDNFRSDEEAAANSEFLATIDLDPANVLQVDHKYPFEINYVDVPTDEAREKLATPAPLFQARIAHLNESEDLLIGSTTEDEINGTLTGYIFNNKTRELTDVTPLFANLDYSNITDDRVFFYKDSGESFIYYAMAEHPGGVMNIANPELVTISAETIAAFTKPAAESKTSRLSSPRWATCPVPTLIAVLIPTILCLAIILHRRYTSVVPAAPGNTSKAKKRRQQSARH